MHFSDDEPPSYKVTGRYITLNRTPQDNPPAYDAVKPAGKLVPLRTLEELKAAVQTTDVYILPILAKSVNSVLTSLRSILPPITPLQHLRRLVKPSFLPPHITKMIPLAATTAVYKSPFLYLLICPTAYIGLSELDSFLRALPIFSELGESPEGPRINIIPVPSCQPISTTQAQEWSGKYWPTVYKRGNPYGPHPAIVENTSKKLERAGEYIQLSRLVGVQAEEAGVGRKFGCVIVDPETGKVAAAAGDTSCTVKGKGWGNPLNHCVMRAVAMVSQKRLEEGVEVMPDNPVNAETALERKYLGTKSASSGEGYLCHNMHVYISHEPCAMCAMALLHSRVGVVVFGRKMPKTGALVAEKMDGGGIGHGLFWRPELNWKFLCWQWVDEEGEGEAEDGMSV